MKKFLKKESCSVPLEIIERVCFEKIMLNLTQKYRISAGNLKGWNLKAHIEEVNYAAAHELAFSLSNFIIHGKKEIKGVFYPPANWWEAFKNEVVYSNKRWYKKYPKVYYYIAKLFGRVKTISIDTSTVYMRYCPHVRSPDTSCHIEFLQFKDYDYMAGPESR